MKKILFMFATAALVLSACSSEDDIVQGGGSLTQLGASGALDFDVYTASATKAGEPVGVMNTEKLKTPDKGFGVFAMYQDNADYAPGSFAPNFMFNEHVHWNGAWTYSPLKYWPNETTTDSQTDPATAVHCDKLSFFAYAPYVKLTGSGTMETNRSSSSPVDAYTDVSAGASGIISYTKEDRQNDPLVEWKYSSDLDKNVDLLWGVAPNGMAYQSVYPTIYIEKEFGKPLTDLVKPDKDQKIKFLFQHALSRIGISVVSAIDQIAAGDDGGVYNNAETRVLINSVKIYGQFGVQGVLNLNNTVANTANWIDASIDRKTTDDLIFTIDNANKNLNPDLEEVAAQITAVGSDVNNFGFMNTGVLPSETTLLSNGVDLSKKVASATPAYAYNTVLYHWVTDHYEVATVASETAELYAKGADGSYQQKTISTGSVNLDGTKKYYKITVTPENASTTAINVNDVYYTRTGSVDGKYVYTYHKATEAITSDFTYYTISGETEAAASSTYASDTYYYGNPRYFMVIPTGASNIKVVIDYDVITKDEKLTGNVSKVKNVITKTTSVDLKSAKAYNLKLILGLTSVKLDATVADWQVDGSNEVYLPQNTAE